MTTDNSSWRFGLGGPTLTGRSARALSRRTKEMDPLWDFQRKLDPPLVSPEETSSLSASIDSGDTYDWFYKRQ